MLKCMICLSHQGWKLHPCREGGKKTLKWCHLTAHAIKHDCASKHQAEIDRRLKLTKEKTTIDKKASFNLVFLGNEQILSGVSYR